jgi:ABC-type transport system involved in multi-copper enzyme maturation permease subunit
LKTILNIAGVTIKELLHERVFYVLGAFALVALCLSLLLGELTYTEQSKISLDFLLAGIQISNLLFSIFMGITLLNRELNLGWIAMVLSKPVSRFHFLLGKFLGQLSIQAIVILMMGVLLVALCKLNEIQIVPLSIFQSLLLTFLEGLVMTAVVYVFAVNMGALIAAAASLSIFALGNFTEGAIKVNSDLEQNPVWLVFKSLIPNLKLFNMKSLASYGLFLEWHQVGIVALYSFVCASMYFIVASLCFSRRDIYT